MLRSRPATLMLLAGLSLIQVTPAAADDSARRVVSLTAEDDLHVAVPRSWRQSVKPSAQQGVQTLEFRPASGSDFQVLISAGRTATPLDPRNFVERASRQAASQSVEGKLALESLCPGTDAGYYFSATDKAPKPGEYRRLTQGVVASGEFSVIFTVLSNGDEGRPKDNTLRALRKLCHSAQPPAARSPSPSSDLGSMELGLPGAPWRLHLDLEGFEMELHRKRPDGSGEMIQASNHSLGVTLSAFVERAKGTPTSEQCREHYWVAAKGDGALADVRRSQRGDMAIGEYTIEVGDGALRLRHLNAYLGAEGGCVDVHLSTGSRQSADADLFAEVLRGVTLR